MSEKVLNIYKGLEVRVTDFADDGIIDNLDMLFRDQREASGSSFRIFQRV
jgi:hypothetical protein